MWGLIGGRRHRVLQCNPDQTVNDGVAHSKNPRKCTYHVTFDLDLDLDLEHTLDAGSPGYHPVQVWWRSSHLPGRRSDLRKRLQTDRRTDAIELAHSWNELTRAKCIRDPEVSLRNTMYNNWLLQLLLAITLYQSLNANFYL